MKAIFNQFRRAQTGASSAIALALSVLGGTAQTNECRLADGSTSLSKPTFQLALRAPPEPAVATEQMIRSSPKPVAHGSVDAAKVPASHAQAPAPVTTSPSRLSKTSLEILSRIEQAGRDQTVNSAGSYSDFRKQARWLEDVAKSTRTAPSRRLGLGDAKSVPDPILGRSQGVHALTITF